MNNSFAKLAAVFAVIVIAGAIGFNQFIGADAKGFTKEEVQEIVKEYINDNPEVIVNAFQKYRTEQQAEQQKEQREQFLANKEKVLSSDVSPTVGSDADDALVVVEFFDYNCGYCKRAIGAVKKVIEENEDVRFVFKEFPILSDSSRVAARYALAAAEQGKYLEYHNALMNAKGGKSEEKLLSIAEDLGLDTEKLKKDAGSSKIEKEISDNRALAQSLGISGTPAFIIGDEMQPGYIPYERMQEIIEQEKDKS